MLSFDYHCNNGKILLLDFTRKKLKGYSNILEQSQPLVYFLLHVPSLFHVFVLSLSFILEDSGVFTITLSRHFYMENEDKLPRHGVVKVSDASNISITLFSTNLLQN